MSNQNKLNKMERLQDIQEENPEIPKSLNPVQSNGRTGYKPTPLGWIPEEWEVVEFGKVANLTKGKFAPNIHNHIKCIELEHIDQNTGTINGFVDSSIQKSTKNTFKKGQILFGKLRPYLRKYWLAEFDGVCSSEIWVLDSNKDRCLNKFLFSVIQLHQFIQVANVSSGSKMPRADWDFVSVFPLPLPPLREQRRIAAILSTWDEAITKTQQLIAQLQQRNKGLMQQLLKGKKRLKGFEKTKLSFAPIISFAKEVSDKNREDKDLIVLSCTKYYGLVPSLEYFGRKIYSDDLTTYKIVSKNSFAYATNHIEEGSIGYQSKYDQALISPMYTVFKTHNSVDDEFLYKILKSHHYIHEYQKRMEGSIDRRGGLRWNDFSKIKIPVPPLEEQKQIAAILSQADDEVKLYEQQLTILQQQKKGLMQKLLTGEVRVKV